MTVSTLRVDEPMSKRERYKGDEGGVGGEISTCQAYRTHVCPNFLSPGDDLQAEHFKRGKLKDMR